MVQRLVLSFISPSQLFVNKKVLILKNVFDNIEFPSFF